MTHHFVYCLLFFKLFTCLWEFHLLHLKSSLSSWPIHFFLPTSVLQLILSHSLFMTKLSQCSGHSHSFLSLQMVITFLELSSHIPNYPFLSPTSIIFFPWIAPIWMQSFSSANFSFFFLSRATDWCPNQSKFWKKWAFCGTDRTQPWYFGESRTVAQRYHIGWGNWTDCYKKPQHFKPEQCPASWIVSSPAAFWHYHSGECKWSRDSPRDRRVSPSCDWCSLCNWIHAAVNSQARTS